MSPKKWKESISFWTKKENGIIDNIHIQVLRYADSRENFTLTQIRNDLNLSDGRVIFLQGQLGESSFFTSVGPAPAHSEPRYALTFEGKSRLLEYDELTLARENSLQAKKYAVVATIISIVSIIISIGIGLFQILTAQDVRIINNSQELETLLYLGCI